MDRHSLPLADLRGLPPGTASERVRQFVQSSQPLNGETGQIDDAIAEFETRYEMSSDEMRRRLRKAEAEHTADTCRWEMLLELRERVARAK
jgi:hypothetical protein